MSDYVECGWNGCFGRGVYGCWVVCYFLLWVCWVIVLIGMYYWNVIGVGGYVYVKL